MFKLKNIKYAAFKSHETHCYEAFLEFCGTGVAYVSNGGYGGPDDIKWIVPEEVKKSILGWADKNLRHTDDQEFQDLYRRATPETLIELWCGHAMNDWLARRELKKLMAKRVLYTRKNEPGIYQTKTAKNATVKANWIYQIRERSSTEKILNKMDFDDALALFEERVQ